MEPFELYREALGTLRLLVLAVGVAVIFAGIALAAYEARGTGGRGRVARQIGSHAALTRFFVREAWPRGKAGRRPSAADGRLCHRDLGGGSAIGSCGAGALPTVLATTIMSEAHEEGAPWRGW